MKRVWKFSLLLTAGLLFKIGWSQNADRGQVLSYGRQQAFYKKQIKKYWSVSPDTAVLLANKAISLATKAHNQQDISLFYLLKGVSFYYQEATDSTLFCLRKCLQSSPSELNDKLTANALTLLSIIHRNCGNYDSALLFSREALQIRKEKLKDSGDIAGSLDNLSTIYREMGDPETAIVYSLKAKDIFTKLGNRHELAYVLGNLSNLYSMVNDKANEYKYTVKTVSLLRQLKDEYGLSNALCNLGSYFLKYQNTDSATYYFHQAGSLYLKSGLLDGYADIQKSMAQIYLQKNETAHAEKALNYALQQFKKSGRLSELAQTQILLAEVQIRKKNFSQALSLLNRAEAIEHKLKNPFLDLKILHKREKLWELSGKPEKALIVSHRIEQLKDSINQANINQKIAEITEKYQNEKVISENEKLKQEQVIAKMKTRQLFLLLIVFGTGIIAIMVIFYLSVQKRKRERIINTHKLLLLKKEKELIQLDLEKSIIKKENLDRENRFHSKQLTTFTLHMTQKNLILRNILSHIKTLEKTDARTVKKKLVDIKIQIINALSSDTDWETFKHYFEKVNTEFFDQLLKKYPNISHKDLKLCALIKLNMNIKEAASVLNVEPNTIRIARYRLRKKMNLRPEDDLYEIIRNI